MRTLALVATIVLVGCGGPSLPACGPPPPADPGVELPDGFPAIADLTLTSSREAGPSLIVEGYLPHAIPAGFERASAAFEASAGYDVTKDEVEQVDAEVFFASEDSTGQVKLQQTCAGRSDVTITIRPL
ncbi:MAG TPA: hypothetical protein VM638_05510 [Actinomycetota bacterium]|nr:hypothetical protein [Actinomycetota bacterium]